MSTVPKYVYLDVCTLCRPFDDQTQMRIRLETEAVQLILSYVRSGELVLVVSPVHDIEINAIDDIAEREHLAVMLRRIGQRPSIDLPSTRERAELFVKKGLGPADAAHLAFAEATGANFITCDDRLLRQCKRIKLIISVSSPLTFCDEENL